MRKILLIALSSFGLMSWVNCATSKKDVKDEWEEAREEQAEALDTTEDYARSQKKKFEKKAAKEIEELQDDLAELRVREVGASGTTQEQYDDAVWAIDQKIWSLKEELRSMRRSPVAGYQDLQARVEDGISDVKDMLNQAEGLAH